MMGHDSAPPPRLPASLRPPDADELFYSLLSLDQTLAGIATQYGPWLYALLFAIIFAETGLVVFPFLPGDSILFIAGTVVATAGLNVHLLVVLLIVAAILGDSVNYAIGHYIGPRVFDQPDSRWFKQEHLRRTQAFYDKYGGVTIIIGRFVPIIRTFAPFLAGVAGMTYRRFLSYNVIGAVLWIASLVYAGYLFGNIPWVKQNLTLIVIGIVVVSLLARRVDVPAGATRAARAAGSGLTTRGGAARVAAANAPDWLDPLREFRREPDVGRGRQRLQPRLRVVRAAQPVDERVQRLARHARASARERLQLLVRIGDAVAAHHRLDRLGQHLPVGVEVGGDARAVDLELGEPLPQRLPAEQRVARARRPCCAAPSSR